MQQLLPNLKSKQRAPTLYFLLQASIVYSILKILRLYLILSTTLVVETKSPSFNWNAFHEQTQTTG